MGADREFRDGSLRSGVLIGAFNPNPWTRTLYVSSTHRRASDTARTGLNPASPLATIAKAVTNARAGDRIVVGPNHVETLTTAGGINFATANVDVVGLGNGVSQPRITLAGSTAATIVMDQPGCSLTNIHFTAGVDSLVTMLAISAAGCRLTDCRISEAGGAFQALSCITTTAAADQLLIEGLQAFQPTAGPANCIEIVGGDHIVIRDCHITGDYSVGCVENKTTAAVELWIGFCTLESVNAADNCITCVATTSGSLVKNMCRLATDVQVTWIVAADMQWFENYGVNLDGETGKLIGTASV